MRPLRDTTRQIEQLRALSSGLTLIAMATALVAAHALGLRWDLSGFAAVAIVGTFGLAFSVLLRRIPRLTPLADSCSILSMLFVTVMTCGAIAMIATRSGAPLSDQRLLDADAALGLSAPHFVLRVAAAPAWLIEWLRRAYSASGQLMVITIIVLPLIGKRIAAWRFSVLISATLLLCTLISFLFPAYGSFSHIDPATVATLPGGAGRYFHAALTSFRTAADPIVSIEAIAGVVCFPSFHTIIALLIVQAWAGIRIVNRVMPAVGATIIVSTLPMGGHYFTDLIAGLILWWACSVALDRVMDRGQATILLAGRAHSMLSRSEPVGAETA